MSHRILIVEDEPLIADELELILTKQGYSVVGIVDEADQALNEIATTKPDLVLLDIQIEGAHDGIWLAARLDIPYIFLTSFQDNHTLERVKLVEPFAYILKPFNERDLIINIELCLNQRKVKNDSQLTGKSEKLFFKKDQEMMSVLSSEILYFEAYDNYTWLHTLSDKYLISHTLKSIEEKLIRLGFCRIHKSYLVNFDAIESISEGFVKVQGKSLLIGKSYKKELMDRLSLL